MRRSQQQSGMGFSAAVLVLLCLVLLFTPRGRAQAVPAGEEPVGGTTPADQPLPGQILGSDLTLNQGVNAINAENQSFDRFGLGLMAQGGAETNFLGTQTNQITTGYMQFGADAGVQNTTARTQMFLLYQPQYNVYPEFTAVNNFDQREFSSLTHTFTPRLGFSWSTTAARFLSLNQYLPQSLGIGGVNVIVPSLGTELRQDSFEMTNAATTLKLQYLWSSRITLAATLTSGFFLMVPADITNPNRSYTERFITSGGDFRLDYLLTPKSQVGVELTPIYIYGLTPTGHEVAETVQGTYTRQLSSTISARVAAGPLFIQSSSPLFGSVQASSYAINAGVFRRLRQSQFSVSYSRSFLINLLSPAIIANSFGGSAYLPFGGRWIFTGAGSYTSDSGSTASYGTGRVIGGQSQIAYQVRRKFQIFALYSLLNENFSQINTTNSLGFTRNQFGAGIRFNLGNPMTSGGFE